MVLYAKLLQFSDEKSPVQEKGLANALTRYTLFQAGLVRRNHLENQQNS